MRIGIVGCGFVADNYIATIAGHANITLIGVYDRDPARLAAFTKFHSLPAFTSLDALLRDDRVELIVNLTNPSSHYEVSMAALLAERHVYRGLGLAAAPCNQLSDSTVTLQREIKSGRLGRIFMVNAEMDDGMVPKLDYPNWRSQSGAPSPAKDEFEVGCTMEHAGYHVTPLVRLFGPVRRVTTFSACLMPDKGKDLGVTIISPDLSVGPLEFDGGIVARLSCSILAPANRSLRVIGEDGVATLSDVWEYHAPVRVSVTGARFRPRPIRKVEKLLVHHMTGMLFGRAVKPVTRRKVSKTAGGHRMDFARGIAQAAQIEESSPAQVGPALALHATAVTLALTPPGANTRAVTMRTSLA